MAGCRAAFESDWMVSAAAKVWNGRDVLSALRYAAVLWALGRVALPEVEWGSAGLTRLAAR